MNLSLLSTSVALSIDSSDISSWTLWAQSRVSHGTQLEDSWQWGKKAWWCGKIDQHDQRLGEFYYFFYALSRCGDGGEVLFALLKRSSQSKAGSVRAGPIVLTCWGMKSEIKKSFNHMIRDWIHGVLGKCNRCLYILLSRWAPIPIAVFIVQGGCVSSSIISQICLRVTTVEAH